MKVCKMGALFMLVFLQLGLLGCGSGAAPVTSKTRALQAGDSWTFDEQSIISGASTENISITRQTLNGESVIASTNTMTYRGSDVSTDIEYMQQDPITGDIMLYGIKTGNNPVITVTDRPLPIIWPGNWEAGKTITLNIHFSDGSYNTDSYTVIGQETVTTPAGSFSAWKCVFSGSFYSRTVWFSPQLGNYVKEEYYSRGTNGISDILRSTNVTGN